MQITRTYQKLTNVEYTFDKSEIITALVDRYKLEVPPGSDVSLYLVYDEVTNSDHAVLNVKITYPNDVESSDNEASKQVEAKQNE